RQARVSSLGPRGNHPSTKFLPSTRQTIGHEKSSCTEPGSWMRPAPRPPGLRLHHVNRVDCPPTRHGRSFFFALTFATRAGLVVDLMVDLAECTWGGSCTWRRRRARSQPRG